MEQLRENSTIEGFRLSPQQRRVWSLISEGGDYCAQCAVLLEGTLDVPRLSRAIHSVVGRHEILRTRFVSMPGSRWPVQAVDGPGAPRLETMGCRAHPDEIGCRVESVLKEQRERPWDWENGPLLRLVLLAPDVRKHVLLVSLPALCADSRTLAGMVEEVVSAYAAGVDEDPFSGDPLQYADLAEWQNEALEAEESQSGRAFWQDARRSAALERALARGTGTGAGTLAGVAIEATELLPDLDRLIETQGISPSIFLLACWQILLWRLDGGEEPAVGIAFDGRNYEELRAVCGPFARYLPLECRLAGDLRLSAVLRQLLALRSELAEWMEYFSWDLVPGGAGERRWFRMGFTLEELSPSREAAGVSFSILEQRARLERFDLHLVCTRRKDDLRIELIYDPASHSDRDWLARLLSCYGILLRNALVSGDPRLDELELLTVEERASLLHQASGGALPLPAVKSTVQLFEEQARRTPESVAVVCGDRSLTYRELDARANRLARALVRRGIGQEALVGIWLERSLDAVVSILGIWKAGGAYLFVDPGLPPGRRAQMLDRAGVRLAITLQPWRGDIPADLEVLCLDRDQADIAAEPNENPLSSAPPSSLALAYVVFTSGSTGQPKGIPATHAGIVNYLAYLTATYALGPGDTVLQLAGLSFDAAVRDTIGPLTAGARIIVLPQEEVRSAATILARITEHRPTAILSLVPTLLREILQAAGDGRWIGRGPRLILASGERLDFADCRRAKEVFGPDLRVVNQYGPTECTMTSTFLQVDEAPGGGEAVPIGRPIPNARLYLLDRFLEPAVPGAPGEVCIAGPGVARGYLGQPDLTARCFVPDLFSDEAGSRMYRTGDLARQLPDGHLELLGRADRQVKLRGLRIELDEIETALRCAPGVRACAVVLRERAAGQQIVAYFVPTGKPAPQASELRSALARDLPDWMIPALFMPLDTLPTTANGKIDRQALPAPDDGRAGGDARFVAPRTPEEELVADVWAAVLGCDQVGAHDNFFDLGGHSLLATRVVSRLAEIFQVPLPLQSIFERPTVAGMAEAIEELGRTGAGGAFAAIERVPPGERVPLSLSQLRIWFLERLQPGGSGWIIPASALRLLGSLQVPVLSRSLREIVGRHATLRTRFEESEEEPFQIIEPEIDVELPVIDLRALRPAVREDEGRRILEMETLRPFDLGTAPLLRARLVRLADQEHWVCAALHHIVGDGWSMGVLARELLTLYVAFSRREPSPLAELPIQYADFAWSQRRRLQGNVLDGLVAFWKGQLVPPPPRLALPADRPRDPRREVRQSEKLLEHSPVVSAELRQLRQLGRREGATLFMVLAAAFKALLHRYSGATDIALGTPNAGRSRPQTEGMIGNFADLLVLRSDLSGDPEFSELLARERKVALEALAHQELPFVKLTEILRQQGLREAPFQAMLAFQNLPGPPPLALDLAVESLVLARDRQIEREVAVNLREAGDQVVGSLTCNPELFDRDTVIRWAGHFASLLGDVASNPGRRLSEVAFCTEAERQQLCREWPWDLPVHGLERVFAEVSGGLEAAFPSLSPAPPVYLLDRSLHPVPLGIEGEVFLAAPLLSPAAAGERAVPDPFALEPGGSLLRTGVRARWRRAGLLEIARPGADRALSQDPAGEAGAGVTERWERLSQRGARLSQSKQALLEKIMAGRPGGSGLGAAEIIPRRDRGPAPLSFSQERMWFLHQMEPDSPAYNVPVALRLQGALSLRALRASLAEIVRRHEILRTRYAMAADERPVHSVDPPDGAPLLVVDLTAIPPGDRERLVDSLRHAAARLPFDLLRGPVLRVWLLRLQPEEHLLLATLHHIASDAASAGLFVQEMVTLYTAALDGRPARLPELPIQYADFAFWQRQRLQGAILDGELAYWRERLNGAPPVLDLPLDHPRPPIQTFHGASQDCGLAADLTHSLSELGRGAAATLFMVVLAGFHALLYRCTGQAAICVGTPMSGRDRVETEKLIGFFINTLVIRADLAAAPSFRDLLRQVRQRTLEAHSHQDLPFEKLVAELGVERSLSHSPLFQVMFSLQGGGASKQAPQLPGLTIQRTGAASGTAKFDLTLAMGQRGDRLAGGLEYNTDLFDATTIRRLLNRFRTLLWAVVLEPGRPLLDLPLLAASERHQLRAEWNDTRVGRNGDLLVHGLFEIQARDRPEETALAWSAGELSYAELDRRAEALAVRLRRAGAGPDTVVALCGERSPETIVGLLAILKSGAAILPLDPEYPLERLELMLRDSGARVLLAPDHFLEQLPAGPAISLALALDPEVGEGTAGVPMPAVPPVSGDHLAYVIYTSGSTGRPKGIAMSHRALVNLMLWQIESRPAGPGVRTAQFAPLSFDVAFQEMFATWAAGGVLLLVPPAARRDPQALLELLRRRQVERLYLPFVALQHLAEAAEGAAELPGSLREVFTAGEQLRITPPIRVFFERLAPCRLHNQYGPAESHVVTEHTLAGPAAEWPELPPIGRPIANARITLLDLAGRPAPLAVAGELCISGTGLARGYLGKPGLTADRFRPDPQPEAAGDRLYRTGDLARARADGCLEFLGRIDQQVKVRGFRIEPAEIETTLARHPAVRQAAIVARQAPAGDTRLVAYVVLAEGAETAASDLRRFLAGKLPEFMVPSSFVVLDALPVTPSGKVDRRSLPALEEIRTEPARDRVPPRTATEELLADIWAEVLGPVQIGIQDNFFALGGHSLLAMRVLSRMQRTFRIELPLRRIFEAPTIAALAEIVDAERSARPGDLTAIADALSRIQALSDEEVQALLSEQPGSGS
jgi:amino acid adenylation domain-containing protein